MNEPKSRIWSKIGCFYALTMLFSFAFGAFILRAGKLEAGNLLYVIGTMWSPALAAFATKRIFGEKIRDPRGAGGRRVTLGWHILFRLVTRYRSISSYGSPDSA